MIERLLQIAGLRRDEAVHGFRMLFSANSFPGAQAHLQHAEGESGGNWYTWNDQESKGWLCPAMFKYFADAPKHIYVRAERLTR
jgi:hypothetical protein